MKQYILNVLPRIKQFSYTLDRKEIFIEHPWVIIDENQNKQKYIFKRSGELIMSLNGQVTMGKWEYVPSARALLIDRIKDKILLNQNFIDPAVMILKMDGIKDENFILANENLIPDLDVEGYIKRLYYQKNHITVIKELQSGTYLELHNFEVGHSIGYAIGNKVSIEGEDVPDTTLIDKTSGKKFVIKDSRINHILVNVSYYTNKGTLVIEEKLGMGPMRYDSVFMNNLPAPDGKYRLGFMSHIDVKDGQIFSY